MNYPPMQTIGRCLVCVKEPGCMCFGPRSASFRSSEEGLVLSILRSSAALQGDNLGCVVWMSDRCLERGQTPEINMSYTFLSQVRTEQLPLKLSKVERVKETMTTSEVVCRMYLSPKDYKQLKDTQDVLVPLVKRMLQEISGHPSFYNQNGTTSLQELLRAYSVAISLENAGFHLLKPLPNDTVAYASLRFNTHRVCAELCSPPITGRSIFAVPEKRTIVHNLAGALQAFIEDKERWPVMPAYVVDGITSPASQASNPSSKTEQAAGVEEARSAKEVIGTMHAREGMKEKGILAAMWWEHDALKVLVQTVANLDWVENTEQLNFFCQATEAVLGNETTEYPVAETFIESIRLVIKEKGTECLAIYKLLLAVLDIPGVKQAALRSRLFDTLADQYQMMTQDLSLITSSVSSQGSLESMSNSGFSGHRTELHTTTMTLTNPEEGTHVLVQTRHSSSPDCLWTQTPTSSAPHVVYTGSEGTISTLSLELADSSWGGGGGGGGGANAAARNSASPVPSSRHVASRSSVLRESVDKADVPRLTFYWLTQPAHTKTTIGLPDGSAIVLDDAEEERGTGLPPRGSRPAHISRLSAGCIPTRVKKVPFDRVIQRTVHAWGVPSPPPEEKQTSVTYQIKCAILEAFLGFSALNMGGVRSHFSMDVDMDLTDLSDSRDMRDSHESPPNPSGLVVTELLAPTWQVYAGEQPPVRRGPGNRGGALALGVVHEFACRPPQEVQPGPSGVRLFTPQDQTGGSYHALVGGVKSRLTQLMSVKKADACVLEEAVSLINLLGDFVASSPAPAQAQLVAYSCSDTFVDMEIALFKSRRAYYWPISVIKVFHALLHLFRSMLERAGDVVLWEFLIGSLLERSQWVRLVKDYSQVVLFSDKLAQEYGARDLACLRVALWGYFKALVQVVLHQREGYEDCTAVPRDFQASLPSLGQDSLGSLMFLVAPGDGMAPRVLRRSDWGECSDKGGFDGGLHAQVLLFLRTLFSVPKNSFISQSDVSMYYLDLHWNAFKRLYQEAASCNSEVGMVCRLHLEVVREMTTHRETHLYYQVKRLGILELLSDEISLEAREHTAKKLEAFLPPGSSLASKSNMQNFPRSLAFGNSFVVAEGDPTGGRYMPSLPVRDSWSMRGKSAKQKSMESGALTPLEEATEDESKCMSSVSNSTKDVPMASGRAGSGKQASTRLACSRRRGAARLARSKRDMEGVPIEGRNVTDQEGSETITISSPIPPENPDDNKPPLAPSPELLDSPPPVSDNVRVRPRKVAGATDGRKDYRRKNVSNAKAPEAMSPVSDKAQEEEEADKKVEKESPTLVRSASQLLSKPSRIPSVSERQWTGSADGSPSGESPEPTTASNTTDGIATQNPLSRIFEDLPSKITTRGGSPQTELQQMLTIANESYGESRIPRPSGVHTTGSMRSADSQDSATRGRGRSRVQGRGRGRGHGRGQVTRCSSAGSAATRPGRGAVIRGVNRRDTFSGRTTTTSTPAAGAPAAPRRQVTRVPGKKQIANRPVGVSAGNRGVRKSQKETGTAGVDGVRGNKIEKKVASVANSQTAQKKTVQNNGLSPAEDSTQDVTAEIGNEKEIVVEKECKSEKQPGVLEKQEEEEEEEEDEKEKEKQEKEKEKEQERKQEAKEEQEQQQQQQQEAALEQPAEPKGAPVPLLNLASCGVQPRPVVPPPRDLVGSPCYSYSSYASSESQWSDCGFYFRDPNKLTITIPSEKPEAKRESGDSGLPPLKKTPASEDEAGPSYRSPCSGRSGDTSGPPTFGLVCRARNSRDPPRTSTQTVEEANFDFTRASASSNRFMDSGDTLGTGSFVPPSDFEYTGDMSDDARRLHALERKHYGYASSEGTMSIMESSAPSRPISVPPIYLYAAGGGKRVHRSHSFTSIRSSRDSKRPLSREHRRSIADSKKSMGGKRSLLDSRASLAESRRSVLDGRASLMDSRSYLDTLRTIHQTQSSMHIPDDFEWSGDVSDDCRRLEALDRKRRGEFVSSSSGLSMCDTFSEDLHMGRSPHAVPPIQMLGSRTPTGMGGHEMVPLRIAAIDRARSTSVATTDKGPSPCRKRKGSGVSMRSGFKTPSDFEYSGDVSDDARRLEKLERRYYGYSTSTFGTLSTMPSVPGTPNEPVKVPNVSRLKLGKESPQFKSGHHRDGSSISGYPLTSSSFLSTGGKDRALRGDGLNESPRMGPRPGELWSQPTKIWSQATSSSQRSVHYSAMQWSLNENMKDSVGESEVTRLLNAGHARSKNEESRKKYNIATRPAPISDGPLSLGMPEPSATKTKRAKVHSTGEFWDTAEYGPGSEDCEPPNSYSEARKLRSVYQDSEMHTVLLEVLIEGILLEEGTRANRDEESDEDTQKILRDIPMILLHHLNHDCSARVVSKLRERELKRGPDRFRLLRLLVRSQFPLGLYKSTKRVAKGAFAHVHQCSLPVEGGPNTCAVKVVDLPGEGNDQNTLMDLYSEVSILEEFHGKQSICHLYDYGITQDAVFLVMKEYKCSLLEWRQRLPPKCPNVLRLFLRIFRNIVESVKLMHDHNVVHFDLKCSNVLLEPPPDVVDAHFWSPPTEEPEFRVVLADFGEARSYAHKEARTVRNRGTEFNKSPEMLLIANALKRDLPEYDRRKQQGAGPPSDVWALGCLLFELMTGEMLQYDDDWARFFVRVTRNAMPVLSEDRINKLDNQSYDVIIDLLEFMLVRDQSWRPSLTMLLRRLDMVLNRGDLPPYQRAPSRIQELDALPSPIDRFSGIDMMGEITQWRSDVIRLTRRHLLTSLNAARDPWILSENNISMVVLVRGGVATSITGAVRAAAARANIDLLETDVVGDNKPVSDDLVKVILKAGARVGLSCEPKYKRELVNLALKIMEAEYNYEYYEGLLDMWRRLKF